MKLALAAALLLTPALPAAALTPLERLEPQRLRAVHDAIGALAERRRELPAPAGLRDIRAAIHVHSSLSHDSRAPIEEILHAAKRVGVDVVMFTEHPGPKFDYFSDGHRGIRDGVLLVPGAETSGLLLFPTHSMAGETPSGDERTRAQSLVNATSRSGGLAFLSHLEERLDWHLDHLTGSEIYNTHADFKQHGKLIDLLVSPVGMAMLLAGFEHYPQEAFAAIADYPADYLRHYDELCQSNRLTGIAACDAHHNQVYRVIAGLSGEYHLVDYRGQRLASLPSAVVALIELAAGAKPAGRVIGQIDLDPYERTLRHVSTHLLVSRLTRMAIWQALQEGRAYVAFDWIADSTGFTYQAESDGHPILLGSEFVLADGASLRVAAPLPCRFKLVRDGRVVDQRDGAQATWPLTQPGVYRVEAWLELAGELHPWVLANPIYVRAASGSTSARPGRS